MKKTKARSYRKNFFAAALAAMMLTLTCGTAYADTVETATEQTRETVCIAGYDCWEEDGNYYSVVDGDLSLIIDLSDPNHLPKDVTVTDSSAAPLSVARGARYDVDLSSGNTYEGQIDMTNGDCSTPIFFIDKNCSYSRFKFKTKFVLNTSYRFTVGVDYADDEGEGLGSWTTWDYTSYTFSLINPSYITYVLPYEKDFNTICQFDFYADGSSGQKRFNYWMSAVN